MVTIIVPVYNNVQFTRNLVESLRRTDAGYPYTLVIVDNASTDGTAEFLSDSKNFKGIDGYVIKNAENKGFAIANNQAVEMMNGKNEYYCFLNNDTIVTDQWLGNLVAGLERHEECVIAGSKLIHPGSGRIQHAGIYENSAGYPQHKYFGKQGDYLPANQEMEYHSVTGACMLVKSSFFDLIKGFDERYWCGWEDIHLCNIARKLGHEVWYIPDSIVYHYEGQTEGRMIAEDKNFNIYMHTWVLGSMPVENNGIVF